jgi:regulating synaptic membrane exocytosis protein 2
LKTKFLIKYIFFNFEFAHPTIRWSPSLRQTGEPGQLSDFIDGLGPGQLVGRQVLGAPALGDIQLSMCYQKGFLEVEVIRARGLQVNDSLRK